MLVNNILSLLIDNLEYNDIETYINSCIEELELFLQKVDFSKKDNKTYLNFLNNVLFFIDINKYQNISFKQSHQYILSFIKACVKKNIETDTLKAKINQTHLNELYVTHSTSKLIKLLFD